MSKIPPAVLLDGIATVLQVAKDRQWRKPDAKFNQSIELHINLKAYDTQKDKRFSGSIPLPFVARPRMQICVIGDAYHFDQCEKHDIPKKNVEELKKLNKNKKLVKKMCAGFDAFLASESLIKTIPKIVGPYMNRAGKFPTPVQQGEDLRKRIDDMRSVVKFQLKKVLCLGVVVGHVEMEADQVRSNTLKSINFLVSLLKKNWQNVKSIYLKSTFGPAQRLY